MSKERKRRIVYTSLSGNEAMGIRIPRMCINTNGEQKLNQYIRINHQGFEI